MRLVACLSGIDAISPSGIRGSSYRVQRPSRLSTPRPPSRPISIAVSGETTESIGAAIIGRSNLYASICHDVDTFSGSRVRRLGTIAMSSNEYAARARFPGANSISFMSGLSADN